MSKPLKALLLTIGLLAATEAALQVWMRRPIPLAGIPDKGPLCFVLGTSRTMRGLRPSMIEETLRASEVPDAWVANISELGITMFTLFDLYMREIRPLAVDANRRVVLGIEVRASGLNDNYANPAENEKWTRGEYRELVALARGGTGLDAQLAAFDLTGAARTIFGYTALGSGRETLARAQRRAVKGGVPEWAIDEKGFEEFKEVRQRDLEEGTWRHHYSKVILRDYTFGTKQFPMLQLLCRQAQRDGVDVFVYVLPVTDLQKSFWDPPGRRKQVLDEVKKWAATQGIAVVDFDSGHTFALEDFHDTHHVAASGAQKLSRRFAVQALLPRLR
jgi:hypothetical protein